MSAQGEFLKRSISALLFAAASSVALSGFAAAASPPTPTEHGSNLNDQAQVDLLDANVAGQRGDWANSARLAERSYAAKPDLWNEFNLATAYQRTGRSALAVPLYLDLVDRGQYARTAPIYSNDHTWPTPMRPFLADEAAHRLNLMGVTITPAPTTPIMSARLSP